MHETIKAGGQAILNHPNYHYAVSADDMTAVQNLHLFELFNGQTGVKNHGDAQHPSHEELEKRLVPEGLIPAYDGMSVVLK